MADETLPPNGAAVWHAGEAIGKVTSSAYGHTVDAPLALALLPAGLAQVGLPVEVAVGDTRHPAQIVRRPYYDPEGKRLKS
jgi:glycine cleavage system aminomethyltransferase T